MAMPSAFAPASFRARGRIEPRMIGTFAAGGFGSRKPLARSPARVACRKSSVSARRVYGFSKGILFQRSTMMSLEVPMPSTKRPGASSASCAALVAIRAGPRPKTPATAVPKRSVSLPVAETASGRKPSLAATSSDQQSV